MTKRVWVEHHMGMPISIHLRGSDRSLAAADPAVAAAYARLRWVDETFSTYQEQSWVSRLRDGRTVLDLCPPQVQDVAARCEAAGRRTGGAFSAWLPDSQGQRRFDPTGLVKGWAVDLAGEELRGVPGTAFAINAAGDVLVGRHAHVPPTGEDADVWRIGVEDPHAAGQIARVVPLQTGGLATSGTAARGAHLFDPATAQWVARTGSTTVVAPTLEEADIWATALFVGGEAALGCFAESAPGCQTFSL